MAEFPVGISDRSRRSPPMQSTHERPTAGSQAEPVGPSLAGAPGVEACYHPSLSCALPNRMARKLTPMQRPSPHARVSALEWRELGA